MMTIGKDATGKLSGNITPKFENGESWTAPFDTVTMADGKVILKVPDPGGEVIVIIEATFDNSILNRTSIGCADSLTTMKSVEYEHAVSLKAKGAREIRCM